MSEYILSCCSTADLSKEYFESRNIHYICFHYTLGDKSYPDDLGQSVPFDEFYTRMAAGEMTKTSQVNADEFAAYFEGYLKEGKDILHVSLSSGLSGSVNSARIAAEERRNIQTARSMWWIPWGPPPVTVSLWISWRTCVMRERLWRKCVTSPRKTA